MRLSRNLVNSMLSAGLALAVPAWVPAALAQSTSQSQSQTTPPTRTETQNPQTGIANENQNPVNDPTDSTDRQRRNRNRTVQSGTTATDSASSTTTDSQGKSSTTGTSSRNRTDTTTAESKSMIGPTDQQFVMKAAQGGKMEVELAQMAQQKSTNDAVKQLAQKIEQDHTQANKELMDVAKLRGVDVSSATPEAKSQAMKDKLSKLSGADFDKAYLKMMLSDHKKDIKEFERESDRGMDTDVKAFASKTLPALKEHLQMTENVQKGLSGTSASSSSNSMKSSPSGTSDSTNTTTERGTRSRSTDATPGNQPNKGTGTTTTPPQ